MKNYKIGIKGKIVGGKFSANTLGWDIIIKHDEEKTGGYYVISSNPKNPSMKAGGMFDSWFQNEKELDIQFSGPNPVWIVDWEK